MLYWALLFLVVAIVAGIFGFAGIAAAAAAGIAKLLFVIFLVLFAIAMISHLGRRGQQRGLDIDVGVPPKGAPFQPRRIVSAEMVMSACSRSGLPRQPWIRGESRRKMKAVGRQGGFDRPNAPERPSLRRRAARGEPPP